MINYLANNWWLFLLYSIASIFSASVVLYRYSILPPLTKWDIFLVYLSFVFDCLGRACLILTVIGLLCRIL